MLASQSIPYLELAQAGQHALLVESHHAQRALEELRRYEEENRGFRLKRALPPAAPFASVGTVLGALVLVALALAQWRGALGHDWVAAGAARASAIRAGALERTVTALTLHADVPHLLSNLVFGGLFAYLLFHTAGAGIGALALLVAGALGNLANAWLRAGEHLSIGASTAVFAAVGLLGGTEARARHLLAEPRARRIAPVGAALLLLLYLGVGEARPTSRVDVLAHVFGLLAGLALGPLLGSLPRAWIEQRGLQVGAALLALLALALAWLRVLAS
ncbi:MAG TPA: rhomboid family intramembrane serine protease [Planctomycetota bacterium]